jgi:shikimate dehydrogenase
VIALTAIADRIVVIARDEDRAARALKLSDRTRFAPWEAANTALAADLVISTTPAGASDSLEPSSGVLVDVVYAPWPTPLASRWEGVVIDGLELLARQAARQIEIFFPGTSVELVYPIVNAAGRGT